MDKRTRARELTMQALYQLDVQGSDLLASLEQFFVESEPDDHVRRLALGWSRGTWSSLAECDELISRAIIKWRLSRLSPVDRSILRMSVYHLKSCSDIPPKVVINEAVELAKRFSTAQSPSFVNGVLDAVMRNLQQACETATERDDENNSGS